MQVTTGRLGIPARQCTFMQFMPNSQLYETGKRLNGF